MSHIMHSMKFISELKLMTHMVGIGNELCLSVSHRHQPNLLIVDRDIVVQVNL